MKKLILCLLLFSACFQLFSQTEKGNLLLGGSGSLGIQDDGFRTLFIFNVSPDVGLFVQDDLAIGGSITLGYTGGNRLSFGTFRFAPFGRYYFGQIKQARAFLSASAGLQANVGDVEATFFTGHAGPGLAFFLTDDMALEASLPLAYLANLDGGDSFLFAGVQLGFQFYLSVK